MKKGLQIGLICGMAVLIAVDIGLFCVGSLEAYPTPEQVEKGRLLYGLLAVTLTALFVPLLVKVCKKPK